MCIDMRILMCMTRRLCMRIDLFAETWMVRTMVREAVGSDGDDSDETILIASTADEAVSDLEASNTCGRKTVPSHSAQIVTVTVNGWQR